MNMKLSPDKRFVLWEVVGMPTVWIHLSEQYNVTHDIDKRLRRMKDLRATFEEDDDEAASRRAQSGCVCG